MPAKKASSDWHSLRETSVSQWKLHYSLAYILYPSLNQQEIALLYNRI